MLEFVTLTVIAKTLMYFILALLAVSIVVLALSFLFTESKFSIAHLFDNAYSDNPDHKSGSGNNSRENGRANH